MGLQDLPDIAMDLITMNVLFPGGKMDPQLCSENTDINQFVRKWNEPFGTCRQFRQSLKRILMDKSTKEVLRDCLADVNVSGLSTAACMLLALRTCNSRYNEVSDTIVHLAKLAAKDSSHWPAPQPAESDFAELFLQLTDEDMNDLLSELIEVGYVPVLDILYALHASCGKRILDVVNIHYQIIEYH